MTNTWEGTMGSKSSTLVFTLCLDSGIEPDPQLQVGILATLMNWG